MQVCRLGNTLPDDRSSRDGGSLEIHSEGHVIATIETARMAGVDSCGLCDVRLCVRAFKWFYSF
ncbi:hypothetical protein J6590_055131 [Homalodisca vitripennis]|nr:hypothetical protein J6590_055131 [Homalodisca vitripennis]